MFFLIYLAVFFLLIGVSWTSIAKNPIGITDIVPAIWESVKKTLDLKEGNGLAIIAMAFLLYAVLQSKSVDALFISKRKWLQKRKFAAVAIITITTSLLASSLWWADEFIHFYPLIVPFLLSMGFDTFSSILCLWGGSAVGIIGSLSSQGRTPIFNGYVNPNANTHFTGSEGFLFSAIIWVILTTILVFFNIWYCNKIQKKPATLPANNQVKSEKIPTFNWRRKLILFLGFFFIVVSIAGSFSCFAGTKVVQETSKNVPKWVCGEVNEEEYNDLGKVKVSSESSPNKEKKEDEKNENEMVLAKKVSKPTSSWKKFGQWGNPQLIYWFTIGGIIICLVAKLNIFETLITTISKTASIIVIYVFSCTVVILLERMQLQEIKSLGFLPKNRFAILPIIFLVFFILYFFAINIARAILPIMAKTLKSYSTNTLAYSVVVIHMARMLANTVSPLGGNLQMSLQATKISYKEYIKKTWLLWIIVSAVCLVLILALPVFIDRSSS